MADSNSDVNLQVNAESADVQPLLKTVGTRTTEWIPKRYVIFFVTTLGYFTVYLQRSSFNIALVAMVNFTESDKSDANSSNICPNIKYSINSSSNGPKEGEFNWDSQTQDLLLGSFYYGYIVFQFLGGFLADRYSGKIVLGTCIFLPSVLWLFMPLLARWDVRSLIAARVLTGLIQGPMFPSIYSIFGRWTPVLERARVMSILSLGSKIGSLVSPPLTGLLCDSGFLGGWPSSFYLFGTVGCMWFIVWIFIMHDSPAKHPKISEDERKYIEGSIGVITFASEKRTPWCKIFMSIPIWAMLYSGLCDGVGYYVFFNDFPIYVKQVLRFDIEQNGLLNAAAQILDGCTSVLAGYLADCLQRRATFSVTVLRKFFTALGHGAAGLCILGVALSTCDQRVGVALLVIGMGMGGFTQAGFSVNPLDLAPQYSGTIMGILNTIENVGGFVSPALVQAITNNSANKAEWQVVFYVTAAVFCSSVFVYVIFGSSKEQSWATRTSTQTENEEGQTQT